MRKPIDLGELAYGVLAIAENATAEIRIRTVSNLFIKNTNKFDVLETVISLQAHQTISKTY